MFSRSYTGDHWNWNDSNDHIAFEKLAGDMGMFGFEERSGGRKAPAIERKLLCSLEELYSGTTKKLQISRDVLLRNGGSTTVKEIIEVDIKPGWKSGTKITFPEKGNEEPGIIPSDLVIIVHEKPHALFERDGNDLIVTQNLSIADALIGYTIQLQTLDGRSLTVPIDNVVTPTYKKVIKGEGMPISKEPTRKGDLRIKFNITFPERLTPDQRTLIKRAFTSY